MASSEARYTIVLNVTVSPEGDRRGLLIHFSMQEEGEDHIMYQENPAWHDIPDRSMGIDPIEWIIRKLMAWIRPWLPKELKRVPPLEFTGYTFTGLKYGSALRLEKALHRAKGRTFRLGDIVNATKPKKKKDKG